MSYAFGAKGSVPAKGLASLPNLQTMFLKSRLNDLLTDWRTWPKFWEYVISPTFMSDHPGACCYLYTMISMFCMHTFVLHTIVNMLILETM